MKKESIYKLLIALLLIVNLVQLGGHLFAPKPPHKAGEKFREQAVQLLALDNAQKQQFFELAESHKNAMSALHKQQQQLTERYFQQPTSELLTQITRIDKEKITLTEAHFQDVKKLLTSDQQPQFEAFKQAALRIIIH